MKAVIIKGTRTLFNTTLLSIMFILYHSPVNPINPDGLADERLLFLLFNWIIMFHNEMVLHILISWKYIF